MPFNPDRLVYPVKNPHLRIAVIECDRCPECNGDLDTGWECNDCQFDARPIAYPKHVINACFNGDSPNAKTTD